MIIKFFKLIANLPLIFFHMIGIVLGWIIFLGSKKFRNRTIKNCCEIAKFNHKILYKSVGEFGKSLIELIVLWFRPVEKCNQLIKNIYNIHLVNQAIQDNKAIIFLTPHLGSFEILSLYVGFYTPLTILYRSPKPKLKFLEEFMMFGRQKGFVKTATADLKGVRQLIKALKRGELIGILPDQVPTFGDGMMSNFFNQSAYTMNLPIKLANTYNIQIIFAYAKRLNFGRGYDLYFQKFEYNQQDSLENQIQTMNHEIEKIISKYPEQYLWNYNRYK